MWYFIDPGSVTGCLVNFVHKLSHIWHIYLKDLFRENFLWIIFLGALGDAKIEKKLDPNPLGGPRIVKVKV